MDAPRVEELCREAAAHELAGTFEEGLALLEPALGEEAPARLRLAHARLAVQLARFEPRRRDDAMAATLDAQRAAEREDDPAVLAGALVQVGRAHYLGAHHLGEGGFEQAMALFRRALVLAEPTGDGRLIAEAAHCVGLAHERLRELPEGHAQHGRAYALAEAGGHAFEQAHAARHLGYLAFFLQGDPDGAIVRFEESLALFEGSGCRWVLPLAVKSVGDAYFHARSDHARAEPYFRRALVLADDLGRAAVVAEAHLSLGRLFEATGRPDEARAAYARSRDGAEAVGYARQAAEAAALLAAMDGR